MANDPDRTWSSRSFRQRDSLFASDGLQVWDQEERKEVGWWAAARAERPAPVLPRMPGPADPSVGTEPSRRTDDAPSCQHAGVSTAGNSTPRFLGVEIPKGELFQAGPAGGSRVKFPQKTAFCLAQPLPTAAPVTPCCPSPTLLGSSTPTPLLGEPHLSTPRNRMANVPTEPSSGHLAGVHTGPDRAPAQDTALGFAGYFCSLVSGLL